MKKEEARLESRIEFEYIPKKLKSRKQWVCWRFQGREGKAAKVPVNPETGKIPEGIEAQTEQVMKNISAILDEAGYKFSDVIKSTCLLSDMSNFKVMNEIYGKYYPENPPARAAFAVKELPLGALVEIETIAVK